MTHPRGDSNVRPDHRDHDLEAIAASAVGDLSRVDAARIARIVESCEACATLQADLVAIARATRALATAAAAPRDFRLSPAQAERLRGGGWWRRAFRSLVGPRGAGRPLATALTTLGLVGLLVGSQSLNLSLVSLGGATGGGRDLAAQSEPTAAPVPIASTDDAQGPTRSGDAEGAYAAGSPGAPSASNSPKSNGGTETPSAVDDGVGRLDATSPQPISPILIVSVALLAAGLALFVLRRFGRRTV